MRAAWRRAFGHAARLMRTCLLQRAHSRPITAHAALGSASHRTAQMRRDASKMARSRTRTKLRKRWQGRAAGDGESIGARCLVFCWRAYKNLAPTLLSAL